METKCCTRCNQILSIELFVKDKNKKDGHASLCKPCNATRLREARQKNLEYFRAYNRGWSLRNIEKVRAKQKRVVEARRIRNANASHDLAEPKRCPGCGETKPKCEFYRTATAADGFATYCKQCASKKQSRWRSENPVLAQQRDRQSWQKYRENYQRNYAKWISQNRQRRNAYRNQLHTAKMADDPNYRIGMAIRKRILLGLKGLRKSHPTEILIGCSFEECRAYIEKLWLPGMSWDNYGKWPEGWQIDHKVPVAAFNLCQPEQQKACFHFSNLQPLWSKDNLAKSDKLDWKPS